jgi:NAD(P)H-flavin reductase
MAQPADIHAIENPYRPHLLRIGDMRDETTDVRTLRLDFTDEAEARAFPGWGPGQFAEFTVFGEGECVFAISNAPWRPGLEDRPEPTVECTFRAVGKVTNALRSLAPGNIVGFRGPYGNHFPVEDWRGKDLVFLGGGIGMAALRSALLDVLDRKQEFGEVVVLNGARTVADLVYAEEMEAWAEVDGVRVVRTVDPGGETDDWDGEVGVIPAVFENLGLEPDDRIVVACGPPIMLHYLFLSLDKLGYRHDQVMTTLENRMKCGIGLCGRCNVGPFLVCRDGPVVSWQELDALPKDY